MASKFRSVYTGQEIEALLSSIPSKLESTVIKNDFTGGTEFVASAELAKTLKDMIENLEDPNYIKSLILSIEDSNIYTDADKYSVSLIQPSILNNFNFKGVFPDIVSRDAILEEKLTDDSIALVLDDGEGSAFWCKWDIATSAWIEVPFNRAVMERTQTDVEFSGTPVVIASFDYTQYNVAKAIVSAKNSLGDLLHAQEVMFGKSLNETFYSIIVTLGNNGTLFALSVEEDGSTINLVATTSAPDITVSSVKIAEV